MLLAMGAEAPCHTARHELHSGYRAQATDEPACSTGRLSDISRRELPSPARQGRAGELPVRREQHSSAEHSIWCLCAAPTAKTHHESRCPERSKGLPYCGIGGGPDPLCPSSHIEHIQAGAIAHNVGCLQCAGHQGTVHEDCTGCDPLDSRGCKLLAAVGDHSCRQGRLCCLPGQAASCCA